MGDSSLHLIQRTLNTLFGRERESTLCESVYPSLPSLEIPRQHNASSPSSNRLSPPILSLLQSSPSSNPLPTPILSILQSSPSSNPLPPPILSILQSSPSSIHPHQLRLVIPV